MKDNSPMLQSRFSFPKIKTPRVLPIEISGNIITDEFCRYGICKNELSLSITTCPLLKHSTAGLRSLETNIFEEYNIIPLEGCGTVIQTAKAYNRMQDFHYKEVKAITFT